MNGSAKEITMSDVSETTTITIIGDQNMAPADSWALPASNICSYTLPEDGARPSAPLSEGAVRIGNSILSALVPERAIRREEAEDL
jgi:hypothetical protein